MEPEQNNNSLIKKSVMGVLAIGLIAGLGLYLSQSKNKQDVTEEGVAATEENAVPTPSPTTGTSMETTGTTPVASTYKDGTYKATGTYTSPAGTETVSISLTLASDVVVDAAFIGNATHPTSKNWQGKFSEGFTQAVVTKEIDSLNLTVVNGSSLTPKGFNDALASIKSQAKI